MANRGAHSLDQIFCKIIDALQTGLLPLLHFPPPLDYSNMTLPKDWRLLYIKERGKFFFRTMSLIRGGGSGALYIQIESSKACFWPQIAGERDTLSPKYTEGRGRTGEGGH